jgi:hypothetical protein
MLFRERGKNIQILRPSAEKRPEVIGRLAKPKLVLADDVKGRMTAAEVAEVEMFIEHEIGKKERALAAQADQFPETIKAVTQWLESGDKAAAEAFSQKVRRPLSKMRRIIKEKGVVYGNAQRRSQSAPSE